MFLLPLLLAGNLTCHLAFAADAGKIRGWLGVETQPLTEELAKAFGLRRQLGVVVTEVSPGSPAEHADLRVGDVVIEYHDQTVSSPPDLAERVDATKPDSNVRIEVVRFGDVRLLRARIETHAESMSSRHLRSNPKFDALDLQVSPLTVAERLRRGTANTGVKITGVGTGPGTVAGIQAGDIVLMLGKQEARSVQGFIDLVGSVPGGRLLPILIQRGHQRLFLALRIPESP